MQKMTHNQHKELVGMPVETQKSKTMPFLIFMAV